MARTLSVFNSISLDGYFTDGTPDVSWAHDRDPEWTKFTRENASGKAEFVFGRKTYEMMASFWPTKAALDTMPEVARAMNDTRKHVFSRTLDNPAWQNTRVEKGDLATEVRRLKNESGPGLLIMGSGQIVAQLTHAKLIDAYQLVIVPIVLGQGRSLFEGVSGRPRLTLTRTRAFKNGNVVAWYENG